MRFIRHCLLAWALAALAAGPAHALNFVVNSNSSAPDDDAPVDDAICETAANNCSLRAAIEEANERTGPHTITFAASVTAINLTADIPDIRAQVTIDGTNASAPGGRVDINGGAVNGAGGFDCFDLIATGTDQDDTPDPNDYEIRNGNGGQGSTITNLVIRNCTDDGINASGHGYTFSNNRIGTNPLGTAAAVNDGDGIHLSGTIAPPALPPNLGGVLADPPGNLGEIAAFVASLQGALTVIAQPNFIAGNLISGNDQNAIELNNPMTTNTYVAGNIIGLNASAGAAIPNGTGGGAPPAVLIGNGAYGNVFGPGNIVSGNANQGLVLSGAVILPNFIMGNLIGVGNSPVAEVGNTGPGIHLSTTIDDDGTAPDNPTPYTAFIGPANIVSDNKCSSGCTGLTNYGTDADAGLLVDGEGARIFGNAFGAWGFSLAGLDLGDIVSQIGLDTGNDGNGIVLASGGHQVGGAEPFEANFILHNAHHGILVRGTGNIGNKIQGNFIGVAPVDGLDLFTVGNAGNGIVLYSASGTVIGGTDPEEDNVIAGNGVNGIALRNGSPTAGWNNLIQRNQIYANAQTAANLGIAIDLEHDIDVPDAQPDPAGDDPNTNYANFGQNQPVICTGTNLPVAGCQAPAYTAGSGATTVSWTIDTRPNATLRIEVFALREDGMTFLYDLPMTTDGTGLPNGAGCVAGICTSTGTPSSPQDTRGQSIVITATDLFLADVPPVGSGANDDPAANTSEYSLPAAIPQEVEFSSTNFSANESVGSTAVVLSRRGIPTGVVTVDVVLSAMPGTAATGTDYTLLSVNPVTWADGDSADKVFEFTINNDLLDENNETINVELANPTGAVEGTLDATTLTIADNDLPPTLSIADASVAETNATVAMTFTATLSAATSFDVQITYSTSNGSALAGADYTAASNATVTIPAGSLSAPIAIDVLGDTLHEANETFAFTATASNITAAGSDLSATGTINDEDAPPQVSIDDVGPLGEGDGPGATAFNFTISLDTLSGLPVTVRVTDFAAGDTATAPSDFADVNQLVTIPAGTLTMPLTVNVVGDSVFEPLPTETFTLNLAADGVQPLNATIADGTGVGTITNDDTSPGTLQFTPANPDQTVNENVGTATFTVTRSGGTTGAISTTVALGGTAAEGAGNDYTASGLTLNWADGDAADKTVTITVNDDVGQEAAETVTLTLGNFTGGATAGAPDNATLTIAANDAAAGSLQFTPANPDQSVAESAGTVNFTVSRTGGSTGAVSTTVVLGGGATEGVGNDYTTSSLVLSWADGDTADKLVAVSVNDDAAPESDETVTLTLGAPSGGATLGAPSVATLTIQANDAAAGTLQFTPANPDQNVNENVGTATFTITRTGGSSGAVGTTVALGGSAMVGVGNDYTASNLVLTWADGDTTDRTVTLTVNDDVAPEGAETVTLTLGTFVGGAAGGVPGTATLTIAASDAAAGSLQFTPNPADVTVNENVGMVSFTVTRTGGSAGAVSTTVALGGTAVIGVGNDYTTSNLVLAWADGDTTDRTVVVTVNDDVAQEAAETVSLTLGAPVGGATLGTPSAATLTIAANDAPAGTLQFTPNPADQSVAENVGTATFTVTRSGGTAGAIGTTVALGGTAAIGAGNDYTTSGLVLTWADGDATDRTITVTVNDDVAPEGNETVTLTLGAPSGGATLGAPSAATLTIAANDASAGTLQFTPNPADQTVAENVGTATFTVTRSGGSNGAVGTTVALGGTAAIGAGNDYTTSSLVLSWADGDSSNRTVTVTLNDDVSPEGAETVTLTLGAPAGGAVLGTPSNATLTIAANDAAAGSLQFTPNPADQTVAENVGSATFTVTRTGGSAGVIGATVMLSGTATQGGGADYTIAPTTLTWADGDTSNRTITVTVNDDAAPEAAETVVMTLGAPSGGAVIGTPAAATLTISASDQVAGTLQFGAGSTALAVNEAGGSIAFTVSRTGGATGAISINVALGGSATSPGDFTAAPLTLNWADGDTADKTVTFSIVDDPAVEGNEVVNLTLTAPGGGATLGTPAAATLTIVDNDGGLGGGNAAPVTIPSTSLWSLVALMLAMLGLAALTQATSRRT